MTWRKRFYRARGIFSLVSILFLPSSGGGLPKGTLDVVVDGQPMQAVIAKIAVNVIHGPDGSINELPNILRGWFGEQAGTPGRADRVRFHKEADTIVMEPFGLDLKSRSGPKLWERYLREKIPPEFGLAFNQATWNVGFVVSQPHVFLLVTLAKDDMNP